MKLTIIGAGPGGYTAAFAAAEKGIEVTLIDMAEIGGTCLNRGCIPTKTLRSSADAVMLAGRLPEYGVETGPAKICLDTIRKRKDSVIGILRTGLEKSCSRLKVRFVSGQAEVLSAKEVLVHTKDGDETVTGDAVIIASGSRVLELPGLTFDHQYVLNSDDALSLDRIPARLCIVGGGVIGCELACIYRAFGSAVTIVEGQDRVLPMPSVDKDVSTLLNRELRKLKIKVMTGKTLRDLQVSDGVVHAVAATSPFVDVPAEKRTEEPIETDMVLVTVGRKSTADSLGLEKAGVATDKRGWITVDQHLMTNVPGIYAIGDILGPSHVMLAHVASMEGLCALDNILGKERAMDYSVIPSAIFTSPEIGEVGMSEAQAKESCQKVVTGTVQMRELGKAHAMGELPGFFKVIADAESGLLLGLHVAGAHASDLVAEGGIAMEKKATIYDLAATIHAHPTLAEGIYEAARLAVRAAEKLN